MIETLEILSENDVINSGRNFNRSNIQEILVVETLRNKFSSQMARIRSTFVNCLLGCPISFFRIRNEYFYTNMSQIILLVSVIKKIFSMINNP